MCNTVPDRSFLHQDRFPADDTWAAIEFGIIYIGDKIPIPHPNLICFKKVHASSAVHFSPASKGERACAGAVTRLTGGLYAA